MKDRSQHRSGDPGAEVTPTFPKDRIRRQGRFIAALLASAWMISATAHAASPEATTPTEAVSTDLRQPGDTSSAVPADASPAVVTSTAKPTGPLAGIGQTLASHGVYINLKDVAEYQAVTSGGINHGGFGTNWAIFGADFDLQQIANIKGAAIRFSANYVTGQGRNYQFSGATWSTLNNWAAPDGLRLRELAWDQQLFDGKVAVLAGRFNATGDGFDSSELYCRFATFLCATPRMFLVDSAGPTFQSSSWMARILVRPTKGWYFKAGVFEEEPWLRTSNHGGWPGDDWGLNHSAGAFMPVEAGYKTNFKNDDYPRQYTIGATYDSIQYADSLYNTRGMLLPFYKGAAQQHSGRSTIYLQAQQMVWRPNMEQDRGLILFGAANFLTSGFGVMRNSITAGVFDWGPFDARPKDSIALAMEVHMWNHRATQYVHDVGLSKGINTDISNSETLLELNYGLNVTKGVLFAPYVEYMWHPDQFSLSIPRRDLDHAVQVGALLSVNFNEILGLPTLGRLRY